MDGLEYRCLDAMILTGLQIKRSDRCALAGDRPRCWPVAGAREDEEAKDHVAVLSQQAVALFQSLPRKRDLMFGNNLGVEALPAGVAP